ncbi:MAG: cellulase family glycosylhydrolase [Methylobacterium frigidaeris]
MARLLAALVLLLGLPARAAPEPGTGFRRGVGVHTMLNWARTDPERTAYRPAPFDGPAYDLPQVTIRNVAAAGFDFVRLTVDPGPFLQLEGAPRDALDRHLVAVVRRFLAEGLAVIVNLHPNSQVPAYSAVRWLVSTEDPTYRAFLALVGRTARVLAGIGSPAVAFEPLNEPPYGYDPASVRRWQAMCEAMHEAARRSAPDMLLVLTGARGGNRHGLVALDPAPFRGSRVLYSFHYYEPYAFTHQGVPAEDGDAASWRYFSDMPYPAGSVPAALVLDGVAANVDAASGLDPLQRRRALVQAQERASAYLATRFGPADTARAFDEVRDWARRHGVEPGRIILGEFGATRTYGRYRASDPVSYEAWLSDTREAAERRGFAWSLWVLGGTGGMALVTGDGATTLDRGTLRALGLGTGAP